MRCSTLEHGVSHAYKRLTMHTAHNRFIVTFRDSGRILAIAIVQCRISMPCQKLAPRKVILVANLELEPRCAFRVVFCLRIMLRAT
jgi:hypothetical protein